MQPVKKISELLVRYLAPNGGQLSAIHRFSLMDGNRAGKDPTPGQGPPPSTQANAARMAGLDYTPQLSLHNQPTS